VVLIVENRGINMSVINDIRKIANDLTLNWNKVNSIVIGDYEIVKRKHGYNLNIKGKKRTPFFIQEPWETIKRRLSNGLTIERNNKNPKNENIQKI